MNDTIEWNICPRCKKQFRMISSVDGHMHMHCLKCAEEIENNTAKLMVEIYKNDN